jgi:hypothetical protein
MSTSIMHVEKLRSHHKRQGSHVPLWILQDLRCYGEESLALVTCAASDWPMERQFLFFVNGRAPPPPVHILLHVPNHILCLEGKCGAGVSCKLRNNTLTVDCVLFPRSWCPFLHNTWRLRPWTSLCLVSILWGGGGGMTYADVRSSFLIPFCYDVTIDVSIKLQTRCRC